MGYTYSQFINGMKKHNMLVNRKMLSEVIISNPEAFKAIVEKAMAN
jgi:large subunit ribosomal protein L20